MKRGGTKKNSRKISVQDLIFPFDNVFDREALTTVSIAHPVGVNHHCQVVWTRRKMREWLREINNESGVCRKVDLSPINSLDKGCKFLELELVFPGGVLEIENVGFVSPQQRMIEAVENALQDNIISLLEENFPLGFESTAPFFDTGVIDVVTFKGVETNRFGWKQEDKDKIKENWKTSLLQGIERILEEFRTVFEGYELLNCNNGGKIFNVKVRHTRELSLEERSVMERRIKVFINKQGRLIPCHFQ